MEASETLKQFVYGNVPLDQWGAKNGSTDEPWASFDQARRLSLADHSVDAATIWRRIAMDQDADHAADCRLGSSSGTRARRSLLRRWSGSSE
jgi:hypothetical protein